MNTEEIVKYIFYISIVLVLIYFIYYVSNIKQNIIIKKEVIEVCANKNEKDVYIQKAKKNIEKVEHKKEQKEPKQEVKKVENKKEVENKIIRDEDNNIVTRGFCGVDKRDKKRKCAFTRDIFDVTTDIYRDDNDILINNARFSNNKVSINFETDNEVDKLDNSNFSLNINGGIGINAGDSLGFYGDKDFLKTNFNGTKATIMTDMIVNTGNRLVVGQDNFDNTEYDKIEADLVVGTDGDGVGFLSDNITRRVISKYNIIDNKTTSILTNDDNKNIIKIDKICFGDKCISTVVETAITSEDGLGGLVDSGSSVLSNPCDTQPCKNNSLCTNINNNTDYSCICQSGWSGKDCDVSSNYTSCSDNPCVHAVECLDRVDDQYYDCICEEGWTGKNCDEGVSMV